MRRVPRRSLVACGLASLLLATACPVRSWEPDPMRQSPSNEPVVLEVPDDPTVSMKVWFDVGSQDNLPGKEGLALLTG